MTQWVYSFGDGAADGRAEMRNLLGGKGANLAEMSALGLPVPPGFTLTTDVCNAWYAGGYPDDLRAQVTAALARVEQQVGAGFGDGANPLLVSVRSGARASMPGMMDTVLNLGLNDTTVAGLVAVDARFAYDSYRRFITMYSDVVLGIDHFHFEDILDLYKDDNNLIRDTDLGAEDWEKLVHAYKEKVVEESGTPFPQDPQDQLWGAIDAVFASWMTPRAQTYRKLHDIPQDWGTAVTVQAMVFGNRGDDCATGVAFTRNPSTGEKAFYGEFLVNAQGEDVVAGIRTPQSLTIQGREDSGSDLPSMEEIMPDIFQQLNDVRQRLESHYRDMQDIEFTVQAGQLYMLQTRSGKRTAQAALKIAVDLVAEGLITRADAIARIDPHSLDQLLHPTLDPAAERRVIARGLPASPGAASGAVVFTADEAEKKAAAGESVILCRLETSPEDIHGMHAARGIVTARGGMTSHAAVVARGMGRPCVSGAGDMRIDARHNSILVGDLTLRDGDLITIDGATGEIMLGAVPTCEPKLTGDFATVMGWADDLRRLRVRANAETPADCQVARAFGAEGIGLCRTEHMFFDADRIVAVRQMILAESEAERRQALSTILPVQRGDFRDIFRAMSGLPVTIRLLDPPLHEFLPQGAAEMQAVAEAAGVPVSRLHDRAVRLAEVNPMLGHRGCRLGISCPEIYEMQARAIFEAAIAVHKESGVAITPEIMIPLVGLHKELEILRALVERVARAVFAEQKQQVDYLVGTMIELPRAALCAGDIARSANFFSFGTNDLTQTTFGLSRDDAAGFLGHYERRGIVDKDPFVTLDQQGVGELVVMGTERGRATRDDLKVGICGEQGGDPDSVAFCHRAGLDYVSCSPFRVPVARLAAAQAALNQE